MLLFLRKIQLGICHALLLIMVLSLFFQVIAREMGLGGVGWTEEISRFTFISLVFISASYATMMHGHLKISVFSDLLEKWVGQRPVSMFHIFVLIVFDCFMVYFCLENFIDGLRYQNRSPVLGVNQNYLFLALILGFGLNVVIRICDIFKPRNALNWGV